ncbi:DUF1223 domain-containing protein [Ilyomonas limi]|uniref:DUF1223 domain-containing protein n=1 Tax=Ilyomonas limi TaxID=2575867 RepID=A0A4U3KYC6_9BACT|nr:DUF1223 domain-containing protein [Ilyomonas limi]TKK67721.1 DUF1223 domain-containing protein [Ilyomonas limi]
MLRFLFLPVILLACWSCTNSPGKAVAANSDTTLRSSAPSRVLIELFTSQGCSSCLAADKLIGNIITTDTNVIALSFHVDYWDRLGWKDVFSNHDYTLRQQQYAHVLHAEQLYTPQAVVQGKNEMVGSNRTRVLEAINKAKAPIASQIITANAVVNGSNIKLNYSLSATSPKQQVVIVLVQNNATTPVARGENAGAQLTGYNVVRNFIVQPLQDNGSQELTLPDDLKKENASIVLFTQDEQTKEVHAITQLHL